MLAHIDNNNHVHAVPLGPFWLAALAGLLGLALVTAAVWPTRSQDATGPHAVHPDQWVLAVNIKDEQGVHTGPVWYWVQTWDTKAQCEAYKQDPEWQETFLAWAQQEINDHDGKVEIPPAECVQRKNIVQYADQRNL